MLEVPSLKFHCQEVGFPVEVSVNWTACPVAGEAGLKLKDATRAAATVTVWVTMLEPELFVTVKVTVFDPAIVKAWPGFWAVLVVPSPKFHCQEVGVPVEVSVNWTACPATGDEGLYAKDATKEDTEVTAILRLPCLEPELFLAIKVTRYDDGEAKGWFGFFTVLVVPSPKSHCQDVGSPEVVSANCTTCPTVGETGLNTKVAGSAAGMTVMVRIVCLELLLFLAISVIFLNPVFT